MDTHGSVAYGRRTADCVDFKDVRHTQMTSAEYKAAVEGAKSFDEVLRLILLQPKPK